MRGSDRKELKKSVREKLEVGLNKLVRASGTGDEYDRLDPPGGLAQRLVN